MEILSYSDSVTVISPASLRETICAILKMAYKRNTSNKIKKLNSNNIETE